MSLNFVYTVLKRNVQFLILKFKSVNFQTYIFFSLGNFSYLCFMCVCIVQVPCVIFVQVSQFGCTAFALLFDDIEPEISETDKEVYQSFAHAQVAVANEIYEHLYHPKFIFCPTGIVFILHEILSYLHV